MILRWAGLAILYLHLTNCAGAVVDLPPPSGTPPDVNQIVSRWLSFDSGAKSPAGTAAPMVAKPGDWQRLDRVEISPATEVLHTTGWAWRVCLRVSVRNRTNAYAIFVDQTRVMDLRGKVTSDGCDKEQYTDLPVRRARAGI